MASSSRSTDEKGKEKKKTGKCKDFALHANAKKKEKEKTGRMAIAKLFTLCVNIIISNCLNDSLD